MATKDKLVNLRDAELLYGDLRERIEDTREDVGDLSSALNNKANKADTVLTTTLSLGRKSNTTVGNNSTTLGNNNTASGERSLATGFTTVASGGNAVTEGYSTEASGSNSHAEGYDTTASGAFSHSDGKNTVASGESSRASGLGTVAAGRNSSAFGAYNVLDSYSDWPEWAASTQYAIGDKVKRTTTSSGVTTVAGYICKTANSDSTFTYSNWDDQNGKMNYAEIVGNGTANNARSNARTLDWSGNEELAGDLTVLKGTQNETSVSSLKSAIIVLEPAATSGDVGKFLKAKTVTDGKVSEYEFGSASGGGVSDVRINGTSVVSQGVANVPRASGSTWGATKAYSGYGIDFNGNGAYVVGASDDNIKEGNALYKPITPTRQHASTFYGLAKAAGDSTQSASSNAVGTYTEDALSKISDMLNAPVSVSGTTPSITAKSGVRYICGEVATLTIVVPATGIIDVVFESGSTPTVLTVTPPTGVTAVKWANGFNPASLEANTVYELNIANGEYGVACEWT